MAGVGIAIGLLLSWPQAAQVTFSLSLSFLTCGVEMMMSALEGKIMYEKWLGEGEVLCSCWVALLGISIFLAIFLEFCSH